ncbi:hypothetical protein SAMN06273572_10277 [Monaibacterium marinum]|uniref:Uncharacterized protein n=1 Tax=Pontivivens marinum TaxID=1690039 RepID=A0A2C9CPF6_9RHOB|nr:hypothetical protein [Monaibacterium marinum]SOH93401.1 hypothetical protein SAMN06273572_10277 [Monaibacterium marinum]
MSLPAIMLQGLTLLGLTLFLLVPTDTQIGSLLVWSRLDPQVLSKQSGGHWGGLNGPMGTYVVTGTAGTLRDQDALVLLNLDQLATWCGVQV